MESSKIVNYGFKCPKCGCATAEEVLCNAVVSTVFTGCYEDIELNYDPDNAILDASVDRYQCYNCGYVIPDVHCAEEMIEWLHKNGEKEEK